MPAKELREMSTGDLVQKRAELREEIFHLQLRRSTGRLENPMKIRENKKELARVETLLRERELRGGEG